MGLDTCRGDTGDRDGDRAHVGTRSLWGQVICLDNTESQGQR